MYVIVDSSCPHVLSPRLVPYSGRTNGEFIFGENVTHDHCQKIMMSKVERTDSAIFEAIIIELKERMKIIQGSE